MILVAPWNCSDYYLPAWQKRLWLIFEIFAGGQLAYMTGHNKLVSEGFIHFKGWLSSTDKMAAFKTREVSQSQEADNKDANSLEITLLKGTLTRDRYLPPIAQSPEPTSIADDKRELLMKPSLNCQFGTETRVSTLITDTSIMRSLWHSEQRLMCCDIHVIDELIVSQPASWFHRWSQAAFSFRIMSQARTTYHAETH